MNEPVRPLMLYDIPEICRRGRFSRAFAYRLIKLGKLKVIKIGKRTVAKDTDFEACIESFVNYTNSSVINVSD